MEDGGYFYCGQLELSGRLGFFYLNYKGLFPKATRLVFPNGRLAGLMGPLYWVNSTALFEGDVVHILPFGIGHDAVATGFRVFVSVASRLPVTEFGFSSALPGFSVSCFQSLPVKTISEAGGRSTDGTVALILVLLRFPARILSLSLSLVLFSFFSFSSFLTVAFRGLFIKMYFRVTAGTGRVDLRLLAAERSTFFQTFFRPFFPQVFFCSLVPSFSFSFSLL